MMECRRGDIYFVDFGRDTESNLQCGIRPALVVSNNRANENSPVITVIPLTARTYKRPHFPTHVLIPKTSGTGLARNSMALAEQVSTIDKSASWRKKVALPIWGLWQRSRRLFRYRSGLWRDIIERFTFRDAVGMIIAMKK